MEFHDPGIQEGLIVSIQCQMTLVAPVVELIDAAVEQILIHALIGALFSVLVGSTEGTGAVAAVDRFQVDYKRLRCFLCVQEILDILLLQLIPGKEL